MNGLIVLKKLYWWIGNFWLMVATSLTLGGTAAILFPIPRIAREFSPRWFELLLLFSLLSAIPLLIGAIIVAKLMNRQRNLFIASFLYEPPESPVEVKMMGYAVFKKLTALARNVIRSRIAEDHFVLEVTGLEIGAYADTRKRLRSLQDSRADNEYLFEKARGLAYFFGFEVMKKASDYWNEPPQAKPEIPLARGGTRA